MEDGTVRCPKCGAPTLYLIQKEKNSKGEVRITRFYYCQVCGTKVIDEQLVLRPINGKILVFKLPNVRRIIPGKIMRISSRKTRRNGAKHQRH